jgi:predicted Zn-ribbon and HTH transcriptional regulator
MKRPQTAIFERRKYGRVEAALKNVENITKISARKGGILLQKTTVCDTPGVVEKRR